MFLYWLHSRGRRRAVFKKSRGRLGIVNATKRDGGEVGLGSAVLELVGLGHLGATVLMLVVIELDRCEVFTGSSSLGLESTKVEVIERLVGVGEDSLGNVVVQSHHEVELHPNGVGNSSSSQGFLHLHEVLVEGL